MVREPLPKEEVIKAIERTGGARIPVFMCKWWGVGLEERLGGALNAMADDYPEGYGVRNVYITA